MHIFEPRYRQMLVDIHRGERLLSVVLMDKPTSLEPSAPFLPPVRKVAGLGRLTRVERLPNGLFNIDLFGLSRVKILEEIETDKPYRIAKVQPLRDDISEVVETRSEEILNNAFEAFNRVLRKYTQFPGEFLTRFKGLPVGMLLDILAHHVPCDLQIKQDFLEETEPFRRSQKIIEVLDDIYEGPDPSIRVQALTLFPTPSVN